MDCRNNAGCTYYRNPQVEIMTIGDKIVVLGGGESGTGSAVLAKKQGFEVWLSDAGAIPQKYKDVLLKYEIAFEEGTHTEEKLFSATEIIKSPGIPDKAEIIKKCKEKGIGIISEIEFASRYTNAKTIAITGSNGKTTSTLLTYHILQKAGLNVGLAGNVGKSFALQVAENHFDVFVLELSSFQLDGTYEFKPTVSVLLNITPDHLDRYEYKMKNYVASKFRIAQNQTKEEHFIFCADDEETTNWLKEHPVKANNIPFSIKQKVENGAYLDNDTINININSTLTMSIHELALQGKHNIYNSMASAIGAKLFGISDDIIRESLSDFQNVEHRLEPVLKISGIEYINDSKATNVNSTWYALDSMSTPTVWIVGGVDKGNDYNQLLPLVRNKVKAIICLGVDNKKLHEAFDGQVDIIADAASMSEAVKKAYSLGKRGDTVLLSPACASFDLFENYEDRGRQFKQAVREL